ncbi:hypothetical protein Tco_0225155, partial [Tanacetum coccineum]
MKVSYFGQGYRVLRDLLGAQILYTVLPTLVVTSKSLQDGWLNDSQREVMSKDLISNLFSRVKSELIYSLHKYSSKCASKVLLIPTCRNQQGRRRRFTLEPLRRRRFTI